MFPSPAPQSSTLFLINFLHHTKSINQQLLVILMKTWGFGLIFFSPAVRDASSWYSLGKTVSIESKTARLWTSLSLLRRQFLSVSCKVYNNLQQNMYKQNQTTQFGILRLNAVQYMLTYDSIICSYVGLWLTLSTSSYFAKHKDRTSTANCTHQN